MDRALSVEQDMRPFEASQPPHRLHSGSGSLGRLRQELARVGASRAVVFCGRSLAQDPRGLDEVQSALGEMCVGVFDGVQSHSPVQSVLAGAESLRRHQADAAVALGGGSAIVTARAASIVYAEAAHPHELCTRSGADGRMLSPKLHKPKIAQFVIPTTPTTAAPKAGSAVHDDHTGERLALFDPKTRARCIFLEPSLLDTAPIELVQTASLNTFAMAVCGLEGDHDNPVAEALLQHSLQLVATWLPVLLSGCTQEDARMRLMHAAILCGQGTDLAPGGLVTAVGHSLGPATGAANGNVNAVLLPYGMQFNAEVVPNRYERILASLRAWAPSSAETAAEAAVQAVKALLRSVRAPTTLSELGVEPSRFNAIAAHAVHDWSLRGNPRPVTERDLVRILEAAW